MYCTSCGIKMEGSHPFCPNCGAEMAAPEEGQKAKGGKGQNASRKIALWIVAAAVFLVAGAGGFFLSSGGVSLPGGSGEETDAVGEAWEQDAALRVTLDSGEIAAVWPRGEPVVMGQAASLRASASKEALAYIVTAGNSTALNLARVEGVSTVGEADPFPPVLALDGGAVLYARNRTGSLGDLYRWRESAGEEEWLASGVWMPDDGLTGLCISQNGETVLFTDGLAREQDPRSLDFTAYIHRNGRTEEFGRQVIPCRVSDGGGRVLYLDYSGDAVRLYIRSGGADQLLVDGYEESAQVLHNGNLENLVYYNPADDSTYYWREGGEPVRVVFGAPRIYAGRTEYDLGRRGLSGDGFLFVPMVKSFAYIDGENTLGSIFNCGMHVTMNPPTQSAIHTSPSRVHYLTMEGDVYWWDTDGRDDLQVGEVVWYDVDDSQSILYYVDGEGTLRALEDGTVVEYGRWISKAKLDKTVGSVFFLSGQNALYQGQGGGEADLVADGVEEFWILGGRVHYTGTDGTLYRVEEGGPRRMLEGVASVELLGYKDNWNYEG